MRFKASHIRIALLAAAALTAFAIVVGAASGRGGWVARVNGTTIDQEAFDERLEEVQRRYAASLQGADNQALDEFRRTVAEDMVMRELIRQKAEQLDISISPEDVDRAEQDLIGSKFGGDRERYEEALRQQGLGAEKAREEIADGLLIMTVRDRVTADITPPTDDDVRVAYERDPKKYEVAAAIKLRQITVSTETEAVEALARLHQGEDMAQLASEISIDEATRERGGDLDWVQRGSMDDALEQAAFSLSVGGLSAPVQSSLGWHILKVEDLRPPYQRTLDEARETIRKQMQEKSRDGFWTQWLKDLKNQSQIEYNGGYQLAEGA